MAIELGFLAVAIPAVLFAGIAKGGFGSGVAFVATPILALVLPAGEALALMLPLLMVMDAASIRAYWGRWDAVAAQVLILGGMLGVAAGWAVMARVDADAFRLLIGGVAILFVAWQGARALGLAPRAARPMGAPAGLAWGAAAGFTSFVSHAGGPPALVYLLSRGLAKTPFQATMVIAFTVTNALKAGAFAALGLFTPEVLVKAALLAPVAVIGTWIGVRAHFRVSERLFFGIAYALLTLTGAKLVWDGLV
ncbi:MAG: sulfite exporter TauE/SafE family protein [Gemmobacter sp.]